MDLTSSHPLLPPPIQFPHLHHLVVLVFTLCFLFVSYLFVFKGIVFSFNPIIITLFFFSAASLIMFSFVLITLITSCSMFYLRFHFL